ncbi:MAG: hypothetical protein L6R48_10910 [Planctomycetes bacterium]|nr:hypothetical protein [Planctomycetota bacterium]
MNPTNTIQTITPEQAAEWLRQEVNHNNRPMRPTHVSYLAKEIEAGRWELTHQGIAFGLDGRLLDGQHRLAAIVRVGVPIRMFVAKGLSDDAFKAIDGGMKRANHDRVHLVNDYSQNHIICMAIRSYLSEIAKDNHISVGQIEDEFLSKDKAWMMAGAEFAGINNRLLKAGIVASFGIYYFIKAEKAEEFMAGYRDGSGLPMGSPILKLRNDALTGVARDCGYWRAQTLMRAHLHGKSLAMVYAASEDMLGNENTARVIKARSKSRVKAAAVRKLSRMVAAG